MRSSIVLLLSSILPLIHAQQAADGLIVPFTSDLPVCASLCGPLYDVQGACTPPNIATTSSACFCGDARLKPFLQGTTQVSTVCSGVCTQQADLQKIQDWYKSYCNSQGTKPTTTSGGASATPTNGATSTSGTSSSNSNSTADQTWFQSHWKWVVVLIVIFLAIVVGWVGACFLRRRHIRKKEREIEMKPPVAWGPHQMQSQTNGYNYGDGVLDAGGHSKEPNVMGAAVATPANTMGAQRESRGWLRKNRD